MSSLLLYSGHIYNVGTRVIAKKIKRKTMKQTTCLAKANGPAWVIDCIQSVGNHRVWIVLLNRQLRRAHQNLVRFLLTGIGRGVISAISTDSHTGFDCCAGCCCCCSCWRWTPLGPSRLQTDSSTPVSSTFSGFRTARLLLFYWKERKKREKKKEDKWTLSQ